MNETNQMTPSHPTAFFARLQLGFDALNTKNSAKCKALLCIANCKTTDNVLLVGEQAMVLKKQLEQMGVTRVTLSCPFDQAIKNKDKLAHMQVVGENLACMGAQYDLVLLYGTFDEARTPVASLHGILVPGGRVCICSATGRNASRTTLPPATKLAALLAYTNRLDVDIQIDAPHLYMLSATKKAERI